MGLTPIQQLQTYFNGSSKVSGGFQTGAVHAARRPEAGFVQSSVGGIKGNLNHPQAADWCNANELLGSPKKAAFCDYCA
ncbi:hypothetical protein J6E39_07320 [bacterium]|nr:hypothetical protein [bacterium]